MLAGVVGGYIKFRDNINRKANNDVVNRMDGNMDLLLKELNTQGKELDETKAKLNKYIDDFHRIDKELVEIRTLIKTLPLLSVRRIYRRKIL